MSGKIFGFMYYNQCLVLRSIRMLTSVSDYPFIPAKMWWMGPQELSLFLFQDSFATIWINYQNRQFLRWINVQTRPFSSAFDSAFDLVNIPELPGNFETNKNRNLKKTIVKNGNWSNLWGKVAYRSTVIFNTFSANKLYIFVCLFSN